MDVIESTLDMDSDEASSNAEFIVNAVDDLRTIQQKVIDKSYSAKPKFDKRGQILPHERLQLLLDLDSDFVELCGLAGYKQYDDKDGTDAGGGILSGIGYVSGVRCLVIANNSAIKGGTISPAGLKKMLRLQEIALQNRLPIISLSESGGANLNYASEIFVEGARAFANQARLSAAGIPQITVVHGNATAGGAYQPGLSDYVILVKKRTQMFLAGPHLVLAATGEVAKAEDLGGAEMHAQMAGTGEYLAVNDTDAIRIARNIVKMLNWQSELLPAPTYQEPRYPIQDIYRLIPSDTKKSFDMKEIIARIVDDSEFFEFKQEYDNQTLCGWAMIGGTTVGIISNNGPITPQGAAKAAQFIQLSDQTQRPLIFLHNTTGFMVGTDSEQQGVIKHGSKMIQAVANCRVPKISLVVASSYGAGNYAMCGRGLDPHFIFAWPNSRTAVMGGAQAGKVLRLVTEQKQQKAGIEVNSQMLDMIETSTATKLDAESTALFNTSRLHDDGLIDPLDSRKLLIFLLETIAEGQKRTLTATSYGIPRF